MIRFSKLAPAFLLYVVSLPVLTGTVERLFSLLSDVSPNDWINFRYYENPVITILHLVPGLVMLCVAPLQFLPGIRGKHPEIHRFLGRTFIVTGVLSGIGVAWMVIALPAIGGLLTQITTFTVVVAMIAFMVIAVISVRQRKILRHQIYMMRAYGLALSVSTARIFIEFSELALGASFEESFVFASALGVATNVAFVELVVWKRAKRLVYL